MDSERSSGADSLVGISAQGPIQYVILHHTGIHNPHYDLLLQIPNSPLLPTWRIKEPPNTWPPTTAERIKDHRPLYLTFEGPLSENRGTVTRVAQGMATITANDGKTLQLSLTGEIRCELTLPLA